MRTMYNFLYGHCSLRRFSTRLRTKNAVNTSESGFSERKDWDRSCGLYKSTQMTPQSATKGCAIPRPMNAAMIAQVSRSVSIVLDTSCLGIVVRSGAAQAVKQHDREDHDRMEKLRDEVDVHEQKLWARTHFDLTRPLLTQHHWSRLLS